MRKRLSLVSIFGFGLALALAQLLFVGWPQPSNAVTVKSTPVPCVTTSAGVPISGPGQGSTLNCQPTYPGYEYIVPTPVGSSTPTPPPTGPVLASALLTYTGPTAPPKVVGITEAHYSGSWTPSVSPAGIVTASVLGSTLTVSAVSSGTATVTVTDSFSNAASLTAIVSTTTATPGPLSFAPTSIAFSGPTSPPTSVAVSESNYSGLFSATANPVGVVGTSVAGSTITLTPLGSGAATVAVVGGQTGSFAVTVAPPPPTPPPPYFSVARPYGGPTASPLPTTIPQAATMTIAATIKCVLNASGSSIAGFAGSWSFAAGTCDSATNPSTAAGLKFFDASSGQQAVPATSLVAGTAVFIAATENASGISLYVCPQTTSPAWTCGAPTTVAFVGNLANGTNPAYIGIAADGISRQMRGDIWDFALYPPLTAAQVQTIAYRSIPDPYPTATPGPLTLTPPSVSFNGTGGTPAPVAIADPGYAGAFTASPTPAGIVSASVSGSVITLTPVTVGSASVTVQDGGFNAVALPVTVNPVSTSVPSPIYTNPIPATPYPVTIAAFPKVAHVTIVAAINCLVTNSAGADIVSAAGTFAIGAGLCNSAVADPPASTGAHGYDYIGSQQARFTTPNAPAGITVGNGLALGQYVTAYSTDGTNVNTFICKLPYTVGSCVENQVADASVYTVGNVIGYIGLAADGISRPAAGLLHIWAVAEYPIALSLSQVNTIAATIGTDPYPQPLVASPTSLAFATSSSTSQTIAITGNTGALIVTGQAGIVSTSVSGATVTVTPVATGSATLTISAGTSSVTVPVSVGSTSGVLCATSYPAGTYPTYSACFTGNTPYHHRIATLEANGDAAVDSSVAASTWWSSNPHGGYSGINGGSGGVGPLYFVVAGQTGRNVTCTTGPITGLQDNGCNKTMYLPSGAAPQASTDHHMSSIDMTRGNEIDGWGSNSPGCAIGGSIACSAASYYPFTGNGIVGAVWSGDAGGVAFGIADDSAQEILDFVNKGTHISHVGGIEASCLSTSANQGDGVYPDAGKNAEVGCGSYHGPVYGEFIHIKSGVSIPSLTSDKYCQAVLYQGQEYGWETMDIAGGSLYINFEDPHQYNVSPWSSNPWNAISSNSTYNSTNGCVNVVPSGDIEAVKLNGGLPTQYPYGDARN